MQGIRQLVDLAQCVEEILEHAGNEVVLAAPLGLGKPNRLINALYRRIAADPGRRLVMHTALSLDLPRPAGDLQRRFAGPFLARHFGEDYPRLDYVAAMRADRLPPNVRVHEFYFQSGAMLGSNTAQRDYVSLNYTAVARDVARLGVNVIVQLVARRGTTEAARYSLGCNPDVTLDLLDRMREGGVPRPLVVGVVHPELPFLGGDADIGNGDGVLDIVLDAAAETQRLFALPRAAVDDVEYAIGLHASTLVRDGGTLQIGIGALSDALVRALLLRHQNNAEYRDVLGELHAGLPGVDSAPEIGGLTPFVDGLYGSSEMVMDGFMHLRRAGILVRQVHDDLALLQAMDARAIGAELKAGDARALRQFGVLPARLDPARLEKLVRFGILAPEVRLEGQQLWLPGLGMVENDLDAEPTRRALDRHIDGRRILGGRYLQGGFCLGSHALYRWLRELEGDDYEGLAMCRISEVNRLERGIETLAAAERRDARFFNTCMIATALGAAASDALEDGRVVSGVGGQYNFVAMTHEVDSGRSILMLRSTRTVDGRPSSNIRWNYGHVTIPRHLRDIYVTEYGIADLRAKSDEECVLAMLSISDARFHEEIVREAIAARKLSKGFSIPLAWSANTPQGLAERLRPARQSGLLPDYPFGSDFDEVELRLLAALTGLKTSIAEPRRWPGLVRALVFPGEPDQVALERMGLAAPASFKERMLARVVCAALRRSR